VLDPYEEERTGLTTGYYEQTQETTRKIGPSCLRKSVRGGGQGAAVEEGLLAPKTPPACRRQAQNDGKSKSAQAEANATGALGKNPAF
jgi:hypothetical protein